MEDNIRGTSGNSAAVMAQKQKLRRKMLQYLRQMPAEDRTAEAAAVSEKMKRLPEWSGASAILGYAALPHEFPLMPLLQTAYMQGKRVFLPRIDGTMLYFVLWEHADMSELEPGDFGIKVPGAAAPPWNPNEAGESLIIVPGLAFTAEGGRLGRGGGMYDHFLAAHEGLYSTAPCFAAQLQHQLPISEHDIPVNKVVSS